MSYLVGIELGKKSTSIKNCGRWSDIPDEMFPETAIFMNGLGMLQNIFSISILLFLKTGRLKNLRLKGIRS